LSVVSGGLACIVGIAAMAWRIPQFLHYDTASGQDNRDADIPKRGVT